MEHHSSSSRTAETQKSEGERPQNNAVELHWYKHVWNGITALQSSPTRNVRVVVVAFRYFSRQRRGGLAG